MRYVSPTRPLLLSFATVEDSGGEGGGTTIDTAWVAFWLERGKMMLDLMTEKKLRDCNDGVSDPVVVRVFASLSNEVVELFCDGVGEGGGR